MEDSILKSVKMKLNLDPEQTDFDEVVVDHINTAFMSLHQLGVGPASGFAISDANNTWGEFLVGNDPRFSAVRTYVGHVVRLAFDPPDNSYTLNALKDMIREHEWRLEVNANPAPTVVYPDMPVTNYLDLVLPDSGAPFRNTFAQDAIVAISGGDVTSIDVDGVNQGIVSGQVLLRSGSSITLTYTNAPTWAWSLL